MGFKPRSGVEALLLELCVSGGYCLPADAQAAIVADPPGDPESFVDAVLAAEVGRDPLLVDEHERRALVAVVQRWLFA